MLKTKFVSYIDRVSEYAFYLLAASIAFSTAITEIATAIIIFAWLAKKIVMKDFKIFKSFFAALLGIFILWNLVSFINSSYIHQSFRGIIKVVKYSLLFLAASDTFNDKRKIFKFLFFMLGFSIIICINGVIQSILGFDLIRLRAINIMDVIPRIQSSFRHPNNFGAYLVVIISYVLSLILSKNIKFNAKAGLFALFMFLLFCMVNTYSRAAWLALSVSLLILGLLKSKKVFIFFLLFLIMVILIAPQPIKTKITGLFDFQSGTTWSRLKLWNGAVNMVKAHPVIGFGVNTYTQNFSDYKPADFPDEMYSHNCFLQMSTEIGIVGLVIFIVFLSAVFAYIFRCFKYFNDEVMLQSVKGLFAGLLGFLLHAFFDTHLYSVNLAVMFYLLLGFLVSVCAYAKENYKA